MTIPITAEIGTDVRANLVERARQGWKRRLTSLGRDNNLLYFRELKVGTLVLAECDPAALLGVLRGEKRQIDELVVWGDNQEKRARTVRAKAKENLEERGIETLFLAYGLATWSTTDGGRPPSAPVLLLPIRLEPKGSSGKFTIERCGEPQVNEVLLQALEVEHGCKISADELQGLAEGAATEDEEPLVTPQVLFDRLTEATRSLAAGFAINPQAAIGNFAFQKMAMVKDLEAQAGEMAANELVAALAQDAGAIASVRKGFEPTEGLFGGLDEARPDDEFLVFDSDPTQQVAVRQALGTQSLVIQGPPGTGKSQTIANLICQLTATGQTVLFVAQKRAALEVVRGRLADKNLGHLVLDLHAATVAPTSIPARLKESLQLRERVPKGAADGVHSKYSDARRELVEHRRRVHLKRAPSEQSVYEIRGRVLALGRAGVSAKTRWRGAVLERLGPAVSGEAHSRLRDLANYKDLLFKEVSSPWATATLDDVPQVEQAIELVQRLQFTEWPRLKAEVAAFAAASGFRYPRSLGDLSLQLELAAEVNALFERYKEGVFGRQLDQLAIHLQPSLGSAVARAWSTCVDSRYRMAKRMMTGDRRVGLVPARQLLEDAELACSLKNRWAAMDRGGALPISTSPDEANAVLASVRYALSTLVKLVPNAEWESRGLEELEAWSGALAADEQTPARVQRFREIERSLTQAGVDSLLKELRELKAPTKSWPMLFESAWLSSCLERARIEDPRLVEFDGETHSGRVTEFQKLDLDRLQLAAARVRRRHAERLIEAMNAEPGQASLVRREAQKKRKHLRLRELLPQARDVLQSLRPCWMASPLSVSQLLPVGSWFDVVIFDEASQVPPEDAVPAITRARRVVVAGDAKQLPPTSFFADRTSGDEEEGDPEGVDLGGFESLLDLAEASFPKVSLDWHYRSRDESLIAFSNHQIYGGRLITFPGSGVDGAAVTFERVPRASMDGQGESSSLEVSRVVDLVLRHATERPGESLGVITMGMKHADRIEAALREARKGRPELQVFFEESKVDPFFIKNLETVQGDERDAIILTVGYGSSTADGRLKMSFGPLNQDGGERRINVAITRARCRMLVVASFDAGELDVGRTGSVGVKLLRDYLEYAATPEHRLGEVHESLHCPENSFEEDIFHELGRRGLDLVPQVGVSGYRIDLGVRHPAQPGRFVLAIECDGASYHSSPTARARDRLRQQQLEARGWRFHRIWSTDWFQKRDEEVARALASYEAALESADAPWACSGDVVGAADPAAPLAEPPPAPAVRGMRPFVAPGLAIGSYGPRQLDNLARWLLSDGRLRSDDQIVDEMIVELGFSRRGKNIDAALREAVNRVKQKA